MKIEQLIVQHLYNNKSVTLQGIGTIHLSPSVTLPSEGDKDAAIPDNAFSFDYNLRAGEDDALIQYIMQQTRKIRPLAASDLESYSILAKQFLNIGKPLSIEGVGTILKSQTGTYEFVQGSFVSPKLEEISREVKERTEDEISFESPVHKTGNSKKALALLFILLFLVLAGFGLYYFMFKKKPAPVATIEQVIPPVQRVVADTTRPDSNLVSKQQDTLVPATTPVAPDTGIFKVVVKQYSNKPAATKAFNTFTAWGYKMELIEHDSTHYELAIPYHRPLSDTTLTKDSLWRVFQGKTYIIPMKP